MKKMHTIEMRELPSPSTYQTGMPKYNYLSEVSMMHYL